METIRNTYLGKQDERSEGLQEKMEKLNNWPDKKSLLDMPLALPGM